jgi:hypothetical protein
VLERAKTVRALDRAATAIGMQLMKLKIFFTEVISAIEVLFLVGC